MEKEFWLERWSGKQIGWHNDAVHPMLYDHFSALNLGTGARLFVPLCGKTLDIHWVLEQGGRVVGIDLAQTAVAELFEALDLRPKIEVRGDLILYSADNLDVYVGDFFSLTRAELGVVDAVYDRAALVALPLAMRARYAKHLLALTELTPKLVITFEYSQSEMPGPPFSLSEAEVKGHYSQALHVELIASQDVKGGLKGLCAATENVWLLSARQKTI